MRSARRFFRNPAARTSGLCLGPSATWQTRIARRRGRPSRGSPRAGSYLGRSASAMFAALMSPLMMAGLAVLCGALLWGAACGGLGDLSRLMSANSKVPGMQKLPQLDAEAYVTLVVWDTDWPVTWVDGLGYAEFLDAVSLGFQERWPGVEIDYRLFQPGEVEKKMAEAVSAGAGLPDVYIGPLTWHILRGPVVGLGPVLDKQTLSELSPVVLDAVSSGGDIIALPRWVDVSSWAACPVAVQRVGVERISSLRMRGWTWQDVAVFPAGQEKWHLALDPRGGTAFKHILQNALGRGSISEGPREEDMWGAVRAVAEAVWTLRERGRLPDRGGRTYAGVFPAMWKGQALFVGPVNSGFLRHVDERRAMLKTKDPKTVLEEPLLVPVPGLRPGVKHIAPLQVEALAVFSRADDPTGTRARFAAELAAYLAKYATEWPASALKTVPALASLHAGWAERVGIRAENVAFLLEAVKPEAGALSPWVDPALNPPALAAEKMAWDEVLPVLDKVWRGDLQPGSIGPGRFNGASP